MSSLCTHTLHEEYSIPSKLLHYLILQPFVSVLVCTVINFVTFATPKMWIQQPETHDGDDSLTQEAETTTNILQTKALRNSLE